MEILSRQTSDTSGVFASFIDTVSTPEIKLMVTEERKFKLIESLVQLADFPEGRIITLDGLRVEFDEGWGLVRASNTSPALLLRFEAINKGYLEKIKTSFKALLYLADTNINLDF